MGQLIEILVWIAAGGIVLFILFIGVNRQMQKEPKGADGTERNDGPSSPG